MSTDVLALRDALEMREALITDLSDPARFDALPPDRAGAIRERLDAYTRRLVAAMKDNAAVRAETLAGSGVETFRAEWRALPAFDGVTGQSDAVMLVERFLAATPPTPALTAAQLAALEKVADAAAAVLEDPDADEFPDDEWDPRFLVLREALAALATPAPEVERPDPERLLAAIEAQAIGEVEA